MVSNFTCIQSFTFISGPIRQMFVPIIMYGLGLFFVVITESTMFTKYDVAHRVHELHVSAKFHGLI